MMGDKLILGCIVLLLVLVPKGAFVTTKHYTKFRCGPDLKCSCYNFTLVMNCNKRGMETFVIDATQNWTWVEALDLERNPLVSVPDLTMFTNLKNLSLRENGLISTLKENSFAGLEKLELLDLTYMNLSFDKGSIHPKTLLPLKHLKTLRMKQYVPPAAQDDYSFLLPVRETLETLFVIGTLNLATGFDDDFPLLKTLNLGGEYCNLANSFNENFRLANFRNFGLLNLNLRSCNISVVSVDFYKPLVRSLKKLDISCNPIKDALLNITQVLMEGKLEVLVADYINQKPIHCGWNATSRYIIPTLQAVSLQGNHINYFTLEGNSSEFMKALKYLDISYNPLHGDPFDIFNTECKNWFWCDQAIPHRLQYFGIKGITRPYQACGARPVYVSCNDVQHVFRDNWLPYQHVQHPEYLDAYILKKFFDKFNATVEADTKTFIHSNVNTSSLPSNSIVRLLIESVVQHPEAGITVKQLINMTFQASSKSESFLTLARHLCWNHASKEIYKDTMKRWVRLDTTGSSAWTDLAIVFTINHICKRDNWQYGLSFLTDKRFHWIFTNLTTVRATRNEGELLLKPNEFCNDAVYFLNNLRHIDLSHSNINYIACSNITGLNTLGKLECKLCNNHGWNFTGTDFPELYHLDWSYNHVGHLIREGNLFRGFKKLTVLDLQGQFNPIGHFERNDTFSDQEHLSVLNLEDNGIKVWNASLKNHREIRYLYLQKNLIGYIDERFQSEWDEVSKVRRGRFGVYLYGNPINCSCCPEVLKFVKWLKSSEVVNDIDKLKCNGMNKLVSSFPATCAQPQAKGWLISTIIAVSTSAVVVLIVTSFFVRRRLHTTRWRKYAEYVRLTDVESPSVFISFPRRMADDVNELKEKIQDDIILRSSAWDLSDGDLLSHSLSVIVENAKNFILVISDDYFLDDATSKEFRLLESAGLFTRSKVVLILTSANIDADQLPTVLLEMYNDGEFLIWPTCVCGSDEFNNMVGKIIVKVFQ